MSEVSASEDASSEGNAPCMKMGESKSMSDQDDNMKSLASSPELNAIPGTYTFQQVPTLKAYRTPGLRSHEVTEILTLEQEAERSERLKAQQLKEQEHFRRVKLQNDLIEAEKKHQALQRAQRARYLKLQYEEKSRQERIAAHAAKKTAMFHAESHAQEVEELSDRVVQDMAEQRRQSALLLRERKKKQELSWELEQQLRNRKQ